MKRYSVIMRTRGPKECADGQRTVARGRYLRYLKIRDALILQEIADSDPQSSNLDTRKLRTARIRQEIVDRDTKAANPCDTPWRRQMRREKIQRDRIRRYVAKENLKSSNLDLKIRRARARQALVDIDLKCDGLIPQASRRGA